MTTFKNDIALIRISGEIEFNENIQPACLHTDTRDPQPDAQLIVTGWSTATQRTFNWLLLEIIFQIYQIWDNFTHSLNVCALNLFLFSIHLFVLCIFSTLRIGRFIWIGEKVFVTHATISVQPNLFTTFGERTRSSIQQWFQQRPNMCIRLQWPKWQLCRWWWWSATNVSQWIKCCDCYWYCIIWLVTVWFSISKYLHSCSTLFGLDWVHCMAKFGKFSFAWNVYSTQWHAISNESTLLRMFRTLE